MQNTCISLYYPPARPLGREAAYVSAARKVRIYREFNQRGLRDKSTLAVKVQSTLNTQVPWNSDRVASQLEAYISSLGPNGAPRSCMEIGCGTGSSSVWLAQHGAAECVGLDMVAFPLAVGECRVSREYSITASGVWGGINGSATAHTSCKMQCR